MASIHSDPSDDDDLFVGPAMPLLSPFHEPMPQTGLECDSDDESMVDLELPPAVMQMTPPSTISDSTKNELAHTESDRIRSLLASDTENREAGIAVQDITHQNQISSTPGTDMGVVIKEEPLELEIMSWRFKPAEVIGISDDEKDTGIASVKQPHKYGTSMADEVIEISDGEVETEEIIVYDDGSTSVAIKKENPDVEFLGANKNLVEAPEDSSSEDELETPAVPKPDKFPLKMINPNQKRDAATIEKLKRMQKLYKEKHRANNFLTLAKGDVNATQSVFASCSGDTSGVDDFSWMNDTILPEQHLKDFQSLKQSYKAKRKSRKNTLQDDVEYKKAQIEENNRIRLLALETADSDISSDEAKESDDGLFVSDGRSKLRSKSHVFMSDDEEEDDEAAALRKALIGVPTSKTGKMDNLGSKTELSTKRSRAKDREREERSNMLAGIEAILLRDQMRAEEAAAREKEAQEAVKGGRRYNKRKSAKPVDNSAKRTKTGRMNNIGSLLNSNIYEDSNANLDKPALPQVDNKKKKDFITSLIANIPLADQKQANSDRIDIVRSTKILGNYKVVPDGKGNWAFKGMKTSLYHYQVQGAAYMKSREIGDKPPHGGILADEMGLGKTVQTIATMIANPQLDPNCSKCTLIVCSPALMGQWESELEKHAKDDVFDQVSRHHGNKKFSGKGAAKAMESWNIILTTYGEVVRSYPNCDVPKELKTPTEKEAWWEKHWNENRDLLHRAHFYRVVLDEAQVIKNHNSQTSIACRALMAKNRWAISGTPIQNRLEELFPYFKFLRVKHTGSINVFRQNFCLKDSESCNKRLHSMLDGMMVRRTHQDTVLGAPLIKLPQNTQQTIRLKFNKVEREVYDAIRLRCIKVINNVARDGTLEGKERAVIMMFQRLRQMVSHIFTAQEVIEKEFESFNVEAMWNQIIEADPNPTSTEKAMMQGMKNIVAEKGDKPREERGTGFAFTDPKEQQTTPKPRKKVCTLLVAFGKYLKDLKRRCKWAELREASLCHTCGQPPEEPYVTSCMHVYCEECIQQLGYDACHQDLDRTPCRSCGRFFTESVPCGELKELQLRDLSASVFQDAKEHEPIKKPFKLTMNHVDSKNGLLLSTKCTAVKQQVKEWIAEDPNCKIIIFAEWLMVMHILGRVCQQEGWRCCHYNGRMSHNARDESLNAFRDDKPASRVQVLIASLKCGGTGLNLTAASKVICVDLWFNSCVEQQAFARVHRIGQQQETYITRFLIEGTVDEQLLAMQEKKKEIISTAMDDRSIMAQLNLEELLRLFGPVGYNGEKPFIIVDDDEKCAPTLN